MKDNKSNPYLRYSGMAFEMAAYLFVAYLLGSWIDKSLNFQKPYTTASAILIMMVAYLYKVYLDLSRKE